MSILKVSDLKKSYDKGNTFAVDGISFEVEPQDIVGLLGPNGAGKSTTINMISGLLKPDSGTIRYGDGKTFDEWKRNMGLVPQELAIYPEFTAYENVEFFCSLYGFRGAKLKELTEKALEETGIQDAGKKRAGTFSGGMKRRLNIACSIAHEPKLIIMDEPTVGIDPQSRDHILNEIIKLNQKGTSVIYTTHYMEEVEAICNKIVIVDSANIIACGTIDEIRKQISGKQNISIEYLGEPAQAMRAAEELKGIRFVDNVQVSEQKITCTLTSRSEDLFSIIRPIADAGVKIVNINSTEMKLQDIFLSLTGKDLRDE